MDRFSTVALKVVRRIVWMVCWWIEHVLQMLFFLPIKKNRILFSANDGLRYYCNPKYISEYLVQSGADVEIIWGFFHPKQYAGIRGIKAVRIFSLAWLYYSATASTVITNATVHRAQPKRKGQLIINTWHGGGDYKCVASGIKPRETGAMEGRIIRESNRKTDLFLSSSGVFTKNTIRLEHGYDGEVLPVGMPRNDLFFDEKKRTETALRVRERLGVKGFIALYAPTFRGKFWLGYRAEDSFPYQKALKALKERFGAEATILKRAHPGGKIVGEHVEGVIDVTDYPDMQELLCATDLLITDYSSSIWDYALMKRPCLLYMPDLEEYSANRGLSSSVEQWPGIVCRNDDELFEAVRSLDEQACAKKAEEHLNALGSYERGTAARQVCERIFQHIESL